MHKVESLTNEQMVCLKGLGLFTSLVGLPHEFEFEHIALMQQARAEYKAKERANSEYMELYRECLRYSRLERPYSDARKSLTDLLILQGEHTRHTKEYERLRKILSKVGVQEHYILR